MEEALQQARTALLAARTASGIWAGTLSSSALSTATAVVALALSRRMAPGVVPEPQCAVLIEGGLNWLARHANADGGWGDTVLSRSNLSTTTLVWAAFGLMEDGGGRWKAVVDAAERWLTQRVGALDAEHVAKAILDRYASDRTFSVPILTLCALTGRLGAGSVAWRRVIALPFELSVFPATWYAALRLPVVSYALPALIAVGYARHVHAPSRNPVVRWVRGLAAGRAMSVLESVQPSNGGFLEAIPLTSFVVMSLVGSGRADSVVVRRGLGFIVDSALSDGSWRIDTNLSTWVTTLAVQGLSMGGGGAFAEEGAAAVGESVETERSASTMAACRVCDWLLAQQYRVRHPYTNAAAGGWAWTDLPGGVPDADDTSGALLALKHLGVRTERCREAAELGGRWLLDLQNRDGGIPTFCRGWGRLPFDRSSADITAHALRAWSVWEVEMPEAIRSRIREGRGRALKFLARMQEEEGAWGPLWFGNESELDEVNRVYGTSRVLLALAEIGVGRSGEACDEGIGSDLKARARRAAMWMCRVQKVDGGWSGGGAMEAVSSVEETALAVESLSAALEGGVMSREELEGSIRRGVEWLADRVKDGRWREASPIGFYFAKLWYSEALYPLVYTVAALGRARRVLGSA